jgi:hypothetical protein
VHAWFGSTRNRSLLAAIVVGCTILAASAQAALPLKPLSSLGKLKPAPAPGPIGPEGVAIPKGNIFANVLSPKLNQTIDGVTCQRVEKVAFHIHSHLTIFVKGQAFQIPYGIGIGPPIKGVNTTAGPFVTQGSCFMWLHTHTSDGIIHEESPIQQSFTLGQFFAVWGIKLSRSQVGPMKGKVTTFYNDKVWTGDPNAVPLTSEAQIQLDVGTPLVAPEQIKFPKGLAASMAKAK